MQNWILKSGQGVVNRHRSHLHEGVQPLLPEVLAKIDAEGRGFFVATVDLGRIIGKQTRVSTTGKDVIVYAQRVGRQGFSRFVKNREPESCSQVTVILKKGDGGEYILISGWIGTRAEPEPWDQKRTEQSVPFWSQSALIFGSEPIVQGTLCYQCPW